MMRMANSEGPKLDSTSSFAGKEEEEEALQVREAKTGTIPHRFRLMDLPVEILENVISCLDHLAPLEASDIKERKKAAINLIKDPNKPKRYYAYLNSDPPVLNSLESFAVVNRKAYTLCRSWLWKALRFPTCLPAPIELWIDELLPKHGTYVKSLSIELSKNCTKSSTALPLYSSDYDNTGLKAHNRSEGLSPKNVTRLIELCHNISELKITIEFKWSTQTQVDGLEAFLMGLIHQISGLKSLRHFDLYNSNRFIPLNKFLSTMIKNLPMLESFNIHSVNIFHPSDTDAQQSIGWHLSKLQHLSKLLLTNICGVNDSWCSYPWSESITSLDFTLCSDWSPRQAYNLIQHIAPNLTRLELLADTPEWSPLAISRWNSNDKFCLPFLQHLELQFFPVEILASFCLCKTLRYLFWTYRTVEDCQFFRKLVSESIWPQLQFIILLFDQPDNNQHYIDLIGPSLEIELEALKKVCDQQNIRYKFYPPRTGF